MPRTVRPGKTCSTVPVRKRAGRLLVLVDYAALAREGITPETRLPAHEPLVVGARSPFLEEHESLPEAAELALLVMPRQLVITTRAGGRAPAAPPRRPRCGRDLPACPGRVRHIGPRRATPAF